MEPTPDDSPSETRHRRVGLWLLVTALLAVVVWQQIRLQRLETEPDPEGTVSAPAGDSVAEGPEFAEAQNRPRGRREIKEQQAALRALGPEETAQRMLDELQAVTEGDVEKTRILFERLVEEGRARRLLEQRAAAGEISEETLERAVLQLATDSGVYAERLLDPLELDRYFDLRQSWSEGEAYLD